MQKTTLIAGLMALTGATVLAAYFAYSGLGASDTRQGSQAQNQSARPEGGKPADVGATPAGNSPGITVKVAPVRTGVVAVEISAVGSLLANESVMVRPGIPSRIETIHFTEGQMVTAGTKLVTLYPSEYKGRAAASEAEAKLSDQRALRAEELFKKGFISQQGLDEARSNKELAAARKEENLAWLAKTELFAPFTGIIGIRQVSPGAYLQPNQEIARLEDISIIKLDFRVPEIHLEKIKKGQEVAVRVDAYPQEQFTGKIFAIEPAVDEQTRTLLVRARIPNPNSKLRPGLFARVALALGSRDNALLIPEQAIVPRGQESFVFKVTEGKAKLIKVQTGIRRSGEVEIVAGVAAGDIVVTDGQIKIQDGMPVSVIPN